MEKYELENDPQIVEEENQRSDLEKEKLMERLETREI